MKLHPRHEPTTLARIELSEAVSTIIGKHKLTYPELFDMLADVLKSWTKNAVKDERNPG